MKIKQLLNRVIPAPLLEQLRRARAKRNLTSSRIVANAVGQVDAHWRKRIDAVISSPDNARIPRTPSAGQIDGYTITMHNGVRVCANGYYGAGMLNMLIENKGVHEPQEERAFEEVVRLLPDQCVMLELGAYWGFYSLSLLQQRPNAACFLVEPEAQSLLAGKINFRLNGRTGHFIQASVDKSPKEHPKTISVDCFCDKHKLNKLHILHSDIQGYELLMLEGASKCLKAGNVDFIFISTHSDKLHHDCIEKLASFGYVVLADANMKETFSHDGLIVAKHHSIQNPKKIEMSKKQADQHGVACGEPCCD